MKYLMNAWYVACWSDVVREGEMFHRKLLEQDVVFYRQAGGQAVALQDRCPHRFIPLHLGKIVAGKIECAYHGLQFDCTGKCVLNPHGDGKIPAAAKVRSYPVEDRYGMLWIWMGADEPDASLIPKYEMLMQPEEYKTNRGNIVIDANYELIGENLLDLSHVAFLHGGLLGSPQMTAAEPSVREEGDALYIDRWMPNVDVPSVFDMLYKRDGAMVDAWQNIGWFPPAAFLLDAGVKAPGGERENRGWLYGIHILTPETDRTTHYHFASATPRGGAELDEISNAQLGEMRRIAFEDQDKPILNAQQAALGDSDFWSQKPVLLSVDVGAVRFRRRLEAMLRKEQDKAETVRAPARQASVQSAD
ncbi:MAG: aromatic ring-hydroxylating dioxygenase subunit alpha [Pseudomonadota bacterium]